LQGRDDLDDEIAKVEAVHRREALEDALSRLGLFFIREQ
jgi:hypothetical protein